MRPGLGDSFLDFPLSEPSRRPHSPMQRSTDEGAFFPVRVGVEVRPELDSSPRGGCWTMCVPPGSVNTLWIYYTMSLDPECLGQTFLTLRMLCEYVSL